MKSVQNYQQLHHNNVIDIILMWLFQLSKDFTYYSVFSILDFKQAMDFKQANTGRASFFEGGY